KPDFYRYFAPVIAPPKEFPQLCAHRASLGMAKVTVPKFSVARPEPLGNKHLNRTAKEFLARVAECLLRLLIRQSDLAFLIYHDHCVRGCFDHPAEAFFADLQLRREMRRSNRVVA